MIEDYNETLKCIVITQFSYYGGFFKFLKFGHNKHRSSHLGSFSNHQVKSTNVCGTLPSHSLLNPLVRIILPLPRFLDTVKPVLVLQQHKENSFCQQEFYVEGYSYLDPVSKTFHFGPGTYYEFCCFRLFQEALTLVHTWLIYFHAQFPLLLFFCEQQISRNENNHSQSFLTKGVYRTQSNIYDGGFLLVAIKYPLMCN